MERLSQSQRGDSMSPEEWLASQPKQAAPAAPATAPMATAPAAAPMSPDQWLASQQPERGTTMTGLAGAATRGLALPAAGAALGAAMGAPFAGIGAVPGALAGAGAATLAGVVGDPVVSSINSLLGTKYTLPTQAMEDLLTRIGVAEPKTAAERIVQTTAAGAGSAGGSVALGQTLQAAAGPITQGVGRLMAAAPGLQVASGASAG